MLIESVPVIADNLVVCRALMRANRRQLRRCEMAGLRRIDLLRYQGEYPCSYSAQAGP